jgi:hypothetical protein
MRSGTVTNPDGIIWPICQVCGERIACRWRPGWRHVKPGRHGHKPLPVSLPAGPQIH